MTIFSYSPEKLWTIVNNHVDWLNLSIFFLVIFAIFLFRWLLLFYIGKLKQNNRPFALQYDNAIRHVLNWITTYSILLFILFYFSKSEWMFKKLTSLGTENISIFVLIIAILIISMASRASKTFTKFLLPKVYQRYQLDKGIQFTFNRIFHYSIMVIAVIVSLTTVGIDLSALTVFAGVVGVGIGFGMQNIASNFISGIILLFERPIKVGDRVIIDDVIGDVEKINMRATVIKTLDNEHIIVPNSYFLEEKVVNRSYSDPTLRLVIPVGVAYGTDVDKVRTLLLQVAGEERIESSIIISDPEPFVNFVGFGSSSLDFELFVWISNPNQVIVTKSNLNFRINKILAEHKIEIPFPQRDLHIRSVDQTIIDQRNLK
ncbi:mechanosensitive ion channel family protein [Radiobacillus sp. PE A8.2]|uniref:mechanosensitive ion channel family protein n=1 Tax=Radiobacillus sp. PE A8.2 TaxID=3380349 RepID=UPI00388F57A5